MSGGSEEPESDADRQCQHCGCWFAPEGVLPHERHCDLAGFERRLVDLSDPFAVQRADDVALDDVDHGPEPESPDAVGTDAVGSDAPPSPTEGAQTDPSDEMRADGGAMAVPEFADDSEDLDESDGATCSGCGAPSDEVGTPDRLPDEVLDNHPELREFDHLCVECSTDLDGNWTSPVEVFNSDG